MNFLEKLGIEFPIIQAPMAGVQNWELAVAVAEAGGLGSIPCGMLSPEQVCSEISNFKRHSNKLYNLNFFCHNMPPADQPSLITWQNTLSRYYKELAIQPPETLGTLRVPFDHDIADRIEAHRPPILSFHFGLPAQDLVERAKSWGAFIISTATTLEEAQWLEKHGADAVIAQGLEAGGHRGMFLSTNPDSQLPLHEILLQLTSSLTVPIIAAGGISNNQEIQTALRLGASAVQLGTTYLLCNETKTSSLHRDAIKSTTDTALTNVFSGRLARGITNRVMCELDYISENAPAFPYASVAIAPLRSKAESQNSSDFTPLWSGQNRRGCKETSAKELTRELWPEIR